MRSFLEKNLREKAILEIFSYFCPKLKAVWQNKRKERRVTGGFIFQLQGLSAISLHITNNNDKLMEHKVQSIIQQAVLDIKN